MSTGVRRTGQDQANRRAWTRPGSGCVQRELAKRQSDMIKQCWPRNRQEMMLKVIEKANLKAEQCKKGLLLVDKYGWLVNAYARAERSSWIASMKMICFTKKTYGHD